MKIVINIMSEGFDLSDKALELYEKYGGNPMNCTSRNCKILVRVVEELGEEACKRSLCKFKIVEIPDDVKWRIEAYYGGGEYIVEKHRTWH